MHVYYIHLHYSLGIERSVNSVERGGGERESECVRDTEREREKDKSEKVIKLL